MPLLNMKCQDCGATLSINPDDKYMICPYCGSTYTQDTAISIINGTTNIQADNVYVGESFEQKIKAVNTFLDFGDHDSVAKAEKSLAEFKDKFPYEPELYWSFIRLKSKDFKLYDENWVKNTLAKRKEVSELVDDRNRIDAFRTEINEYLHKFRKFDGDLDKTRQQIYDTYSEHLADVLGRIDSVIEKISSLEKQYNIERKKLTYAESHNNKIINDEISRLQHEKVHEECEVGPSYNKHMFKCTVIAFAICIVISALFALASFQISITFFIFNALIASVVLLIIKYQDDRRAINEKTSINSKYDSQISELKQSIEQNRVNREHKENLLAVNFKNDKAKEIANI